MRDPRWLLVAPVVGLVSVFMIGSIALAQPRSVTVQLGQQNASGVTGTATLTDLGNNTTRVVVAVTPATGDHPAHIHMGSCANLNPAPEFPLSNVQNGASTTVVNAALGTIQGAQHAINLHQSAQDVATYVACGDIAREGSAAPNAAPAAAAAAPAAVAPPAAAGAVNAAPAPAQIPTALPRTGDLGAASSVVPLASSGAGALLLVVGLGLRRRARRHRTD